MSGECCWHGNGGPENDPDCCICVSNLCAAPTRKGVLAHEREQRKREREASEWAIAYAIEHGHAQPDPFDSATCPSSCRAEPACAVEGGVTQTIVATKELNKQGVYGNCVQAAVATLLNVSLDSVPHVANFQPWDRALDWWARSAHGLTVRSRPIDHIPQERVLLSARSPRGFMHLVVTEGGQVAWDPHPSHAGITDEIRAAFWFEPWTGDDGCPVCHTGRKAPR